MENNITTNNERFELDVANRLMELTDIMIDIRRPEGLVAIAGICYELIDKNAIDSNLENYYSYLDIAEYASYAGQAIGNDVPTEEIKENWLRPAGDDLSEQQAD